MSARIKQPLQMADHFLQTPQPQMDWGEIRRAKMRCENECASFNSNHGGCSLGLLPTLSCDKFRPVIREWQGISQEMDEPDRGKYA